MLLQAMNVLLGDVCAAAAKPSEKNFAYTSDCVGERVKYQGCLHICMAEPQCVGVRTVLRAVWLQWLQGHGPHGAAVRVRRRCRLQRLQVPLDNQAVNAGSEEAPAAAARILDPLGRRAHDIAVPRNGLHQTTGSSTSDYS